MSVGCGGPSLMLANLPEKHSVPYIVVRINIRNEMKIEMNFIFVIFFSVYYSENVQSNQKMHDLYATMHIF